MISSRVPALVAIVCMGLAARTRGDVFALKDGGEVVGTLVERTDDGAYVVKTADGVQLTLNREQLQKLAPQDKTALEYERRSRSAPDTADAHRELAAWCREQGLTAEADHHLQRVVDLDPADENARRSLDFVRVGDRWLSHDDAMRQRGLTMFEGRWRTAQDIAIRQRNNTVGDGEANWVGRVRLWRGWLDNRREDRVEEAQAEFAAINDPQAAPALVQFLEKEEDDWAFDILLNALGRLDDALAVQTLVRYSLEFEHPNKSRAAAIREDCLAYLTSAARPVSIVPYVTALKSKDNIIVNRAGEALGKLGDPAALSPLIDALVTTHKYLIDPGSGGRTNAAFDPSGGGGGFTTGGERPKYQTVDEDNQRVLAALKKLSGQNFDYDEVAWRRWYVDMLMRQHTNARRDE
jgi:hypothetical protein